MHGLVPKAAQRAFLTRERKDYREFKKLTNSELEQQMLSLPVQPPIWYKLQHHQKVCFVIGALTRRFAMLNDMGTGKSLVAIALIRYFRRLKILQHALILIPNRINKTEWVNELLKHSPNSSYLVLKGSSAEKWALLDNSKALFVFETYAGLIRMVSKKEKRKKGSGMRLVPDPKLLAKITQHFQALVCDESVAVKTHNKLPYRVCRQISKSVKVLYTMTGTPFNRDPSELWAQMYLVDHGETLGETLGLFRACFFKAKDNFWGGVDYTFDKTKEALLNKILANRSIAYEADAADLPHVVPIRKEVTLGEDAQSYYDKAKELLIASKGNFQETKNAFLRMRQISSGFVGYEDDETGERAKFVFPDNPKLDLLLSTVEAVRPEHKVIVFVDFTYSGERITKELNELKIPTLHLYGKTKHPEKVRDAFVQGNKHQVLVLQNQFGVGLNIQVSKYALFYESPVSAIIRKQCERRVERQHSLHKTVFIYDLIMKGTMDERILSFHRENRSLFDAIVRDPSMLL